MKISMYKDSYDYTGTEVELESVLSAIQSQRWKSRITTLRILKDVNRNIYSSKKVHLPAVTFSGTFSRRTINGLQNYSNIICCDIDKCDIKNFRPILIKDKYTYCLFISPSGDGIKLLVKVNNNGQYHTEAVLSLIDYYSYNYGITIDKSCKDVSRLCYVSSDPDMFINEFSEIYCPDIERYKRKEQKVLNIDNAKILSALEDKIRVAMAFAERHYPYSEEEGNRNNHFFLLACRLNELGVTEQETMMFIDSYYPVVPDDCLVTINRTYKRKEYKFNSIKLTRNAPEQFKME